MAASMQTAHVFQRGSDSRNRFYAWFSSLHTRVDMMSLSALDEASLIAVVAEVRNALSRLELLANRFNPQSQLSEVNREAARHPVIVNEELMRMLRLCKEYNRLTERLFDITILSTYVPHQPAIDDLLLGDSCDVSFRRDGILLDLSGFLKGYALETIRRLLSQHHIADALVSLGNSSIMALGNRTNEGNGWTVNVGSGCLTLHDECLSTSGNSNPNHRHIINPQTGAFVEGRRAVSVVTADGIEGEVLSTSFFIADADQRQRLNERFHVRSFTCLPQ